MYNRLDFLLPWYVDGYTDLNREQEDFLDDRLSPFLDWHRASELPCYLVLLDGVEASLDEPATPEGIAATSLQFEQAWYRTQDEALDWMFDLGEQLTDEQVAKFLEEMDERQEELEEEYLERSDEEFFEETYENMLDTAGDYLGRLQDSQREEMLAASERMLRSDRLWLAERAAFIEELGGLMAREPGWQEKILALIERQTLSPSPEYAKVLEHNIAVIQELTADILNSRTEKQDVHLRRELATLRRELTELVAQAEEPAACPVQSEELQSVQS